MQYGCGHTNLQYGHTVCALIFAGFNVRFSASLHCNSERILCVAFFAGATKPFSNERHLYLLVDVKSSDATLRSIR